jgi:hypothetical protein
MSKKHFIKIAAMIRETLNVGRRIKVETQADPVKAEDFNRGVEYAAHVIASNLAFIFKQENPRFDRARFLEACNVNH